ncbi:hypothetical protein P8R33_14720, partial [Qipengyuania sp. XHP0211]|uniref:hypothetical protein n=1 Tax=Qipengyuania sp. XHP0211 TaxID=3038079 RepID=UPI00241D6896
IAHRVRPAGSGTVDFPTPRGVRNSKRKRTVSFAAKKGQDRRSCQAQNDVDHRKKPKEKRRRYGAVSA